MDGRPRWIRLVVLLVAGALLIGACAQDDSAGPDAGVTVSDLEDLERRITALEDRVGAAEEQGDAAVDGGAIEDEELIGQTVTVSGEVTRTVDVNGFVMSSDDEDLAALDSQIGDGILVVSASDPGVSQGDVVQVVGTVREFVIADFESELGIDLDDNLYLEFEDQVALTARSIDTNVPAED
ncbi:MAG TPA: hypothetical protein VGR26_18390 [Acidimicrobiales bacterium]|nr:hypothetical protein [Acidimicrobiales bacterium]